MVRYRKLAVGQIFEEEEEQKKVTFNFFFFSFSGPSTRLCESCRILRGIRGQKRKEKVTLSCNNLIWLTVCQIELVEQPQYGVAVPLVSSNANCLNGSFDHIKISANYTDSLSNRTTTCVPEYQVQQTSNSLAVIFRPPKNSNCNGRNKNVPRWVIAVAVVSCVVFVVVGVSAILVLRRYGYLKWVMRSREKTLSRTKPLASSSSSYTMMNDRGEL